jgi:hypothetical protein
MSQRRDNVFWRVPGMLQCDELMIAVADAVPLSVPFDEMPPKEKFGVGFWSVVVWGLGL